MTSHLGSIVKPVRAAVALAVTCSALVAVAAGTSAAAPASAGRPDTSASREPLTATGLIVETESDTMSTTLKRAAVDAVEATGDDAGVDATAHTGGQTSVVRFDEALPYDQAQEAAQDLEASDGVVSVVPNVVFHKAAVSPVTPSDGEFARQHYLWNAATSSPAGGWSSHAPSLWRATQGNASTRIAVIDTGYLPGSEIAGKVKAQRNYGGADGGVPSGSARDDARDPGDWANPGDCDRQVRSFTPSSWHGTRVATLAAAPVENGGMTGTAPGADLVVAKVLDKCGGELESIRDAIAWSADQGADVINLSLNAYTGDASATRQLCAYYRPAIEHARAKNAVVVAAAGNEIAPAEDSVPAACPGVVSVGAVSSKGFSAFYSNYGPSVDLSAVGGDTYAESIDDAVLAQADPGTKGRTGSFTYAADEGSIGTSFAAPQVAGAAALLRASGLTSAKAVEEGLAQAARPFRARSSQYAAKLIDLGTGPEAFDLNCSGNDWCGKGVLDLSRSPVPLTGTYARQATISGTGEVGEKLTVVPGAWNRVPSFTYQWRRDGKSIPGANANTYVPTRADAGASLSVAMRAAVALFDRFDAFKVTSAARVVTNGAVVSTSGVPSTLQYGRAVTMSVTVKKPGGSAAAGPVELRRGSAVLATARAGATGRASFTVSSKTLGLGAADLRVAYTGDATGKGSSVTKRVRVVKALPSVAITALPAYVSPSERPRLTVKVSAYGLTPTGSLRVYDNGRHVSTASLYSSHDGVRTITLPTLRKGTHQIRVTYTGSSTIEARQSPARQVRSR